MADPQAVPLFAPDGSVRSIPADQVSAALASGGKRAVQMKDPKGVLRYVPEDQIDAAKQAGGTMLDKPADTISAGPKPFTLPWLKSKLYTAADAATEGLPAAGATAGALIGGGAGTGAAPGAGTVAGAAGGAGMGGMAGEALRQILRRQLGFDAPTTGTDAANAIAKEGAIQGAIEGGTEGLGSALGPVLKKTALTQYSRALAPTKAANKAIVKKIAPEMIDRGVTGSLESIEEQGTKNAAAVKPALDAAYDDLQNQFAPKKQAIKGLLPAAPTKVPLAEPQAGEMPGALLPAKRPPIPESAFGVEQKIARGDSGASPIRLTDAAGPDEPYRYYTTSGEGEVPNAPQSEAGVMVTRDPQVANRFSEQAPTPTPRAQGGIPGSGTKVIQDLENLKNSYVVNGKVSNPTAVDAISGVQDIVRQHGADIDPKGLRKLKSIFDDPVAAKGGYAGADLTTAYGVKAQKLAADSIRDIVHSASPDIAALDKEVSFWLNVQKVARESGLRRTGQEGGLLKTLTPLGAAVAGAGGFTAGGVHAGIEAAAAATLSGIMAHVVQQPAWRTLSAVAKDRFASALSRGSVGDLMALALRYGVAQHEESSQEHEQTDQTSH